ncbi:hypothetical protein WAI453_003447 [Rhynchosporium graminicola]
MVREDFLEVNVKVPQFKAIKTQLAESCVNKHYRQEVKVCILPKAPDGRGTIADWPSTFDQSSAFESMEAKQKDK